MSNHVLMTPLTTLTRSGLKRFKKSLALDIPSAHASEAIAAGFGFRTHAALLAAIKAGTPVPLDAFGAAAMTRRAAELGAPHRELESWRVSHALENAAQEHWECNSCQTLFPRLRLCMMPWPFGPASIGVCPDCATAAALHVDHVHYAVEHSFTLDEVWERAIGLPSRRLDAEGRSYAIEGWDRELIGRTGQRMSMRRWLEAHRRVTNTPLPTLRVDLLRLTGHTGWCEVSWKFRKAFTEAIDATIEAIAPRAAYRLEGVDAVEFPPLPFTEVIELAPLADEEREEIAGRLRPQLLAHGVELGNLMLRGRPSRPPDADSGGREDGASVVGGPEGGQLNPGAVAHGWLDLLVDPSAA